MFLLLLHGRRHQVQNQGHHMLGIAVHRLYPCRRHHRHCSLDKFSHDHYCSLDKLSSVCLEAKLILIGSLSSSGKLRLAPEATKAIFANYSTALCSPKLKKNSKFQNWGSEQTCRQSFPEWFGKISKKPKTFVISGA